LSKCEKFNQLMRCDVLMPPNCKWKKNSKRIACVSSSVEFAF